MEFQEKIIDVINGLRLNEQGEVLPESELGWIGYVSGTSLFPPSAMPAVIVDEEYFEAVDTDGGAVGETQSCTIYLITECKNINEMTEAQYMAYKQVNKEKMKQLVGILGREITTARFGRGDVNMTVIDGVPAIVAALEARGIIIN